MGPLDPTTSRQLAGVGMLTTNGNNSHNLTPITKEFCEAIKTGRINKYLLTPSHKTHVNATVLYGWTGGHTNTTSASKTDNLLCVALNEANATPHEPQLICGDVNAGPDDLPTYHKLICERWTDLHAQTHIWGQPPPPNTATSPTYETTPS